MGERGLGPKGVNVAEIIFGDTDEPHHARVPAATGSGALAAHREAKLRQKRDSVALSRIRTCAGKPQQISSLSP
jgi:hypothetical protein